MEYPGYMYRCIDLARRGAGYVAPNPMVGAVLVHQQKVIGEGWHQQFGQSHAEVNCINDAIKNGFADIIHECDLYVSLEPCSHTGKTPPCSDLLIRHRIPRVIVGCRDPFPLVNGKGIEKLKLAGVDVQLAEDTLEKSCIDLNAAFFTFHQKNRPYIILKWAETADGFIGVPGKRLRISNEISDKLVHRWRSETASILVGTNTAVSDDPALTTRLWNGLSPIRLIMDKNLNVPSSHKIYHDDAPTIVFNSVKEEMTGFDTRKMKGLWFSKMESQQDLIPEILEKLYRLQIQSVLVEGGAKTLQSFIDAGVWDEARVIRNTTLRIDNGITAPSLTNATEIESCSMENDQVTIFRPANP